MHTHISTLATAYQAPAPLNGAIVVLLVLFLVMTVFSLFFENRKFRFWGFTILTVMLIGCLVSKLPFVQDVGTTITTAITNGLGEKVTDFLGSGAWNIIAFLLALGGIWVYSRAFKRYGEKLDKSVMGWFVLATFMMAGFFTSSFGQQIVAGIVKILEPVWNFMA